MLKLAGLVKENGLIFVLKTDRSSSLHSDSVLTQGNALGDTTGVKHVYLCTNYVHLCFYSERPAIIF